MPFSTGDQQDLLQLQALSTHFTTILDKESTIDPTLPGGRQLTDANIAKINETYASVLDVIKQIVDAQLILT